jgi:hypothetical protein
MWQTILLVMILGKGWLPLEDTGGLHESQFACFNRGAEMLQQVTAKMPVISADVKCLKKRDDDGRGGEDKEIGV